jgi:molecular chaperone GrpE (heat shock protein)
MPPPPPPGGLAAPPPPQKTSDDDSPGILTAPSLPVLPDASPDDDSDLGDEDKSYKKMWQRRSNKPLQQVYGHIDRLGEGETGSLLDRYADRFGHDLDREIIVLRGKEHSDAETAVRDAPTVELIIEDIEDAEELEQVDEAEEIEEPSPEEDADDDDDSGYDNDLSEEEETELQSQLEVLEDEIKRLKPKYTLAKKKGQKAKLSKLKPALKSLIDSRKQVLSVLSGEESIESLSSEETEGDGDEMFIQLVGIVDDLLGMMPEDAINEFLASSEFETYKLVAGAPADADDEMRVEFFEIVDSKLGQMPEDAINDFVASDDFAIYQAVGSELRS